MNITDGHNLYTGIYFRPKLDVTCSCIFSYTLFKLKAALGGHKCECRNWREDPDFKCTLNDFSSP